MQATIERLILRGFIHFGYFISDSVCPATIGIRANEKERTDCPIIYLRVFIDIRPAFMSQANVSQKIQGQDKNKALSEMWVNFY